MALRTANFCIDAHDPQAQVAWWGQVLDDFEPDGDNSDDEAGLRGPGGRSLLFLKVPEPKVVKNRVHLDVKVSGGRNVDPRTRERRIRTKQAELVGAGALTLREDRVGADLDHLVMADPEGNEFCIV